VFNNIFFFENRAVYDIMWKNVVERGRPQMTIWRMRIACWIPVAINTHSEYVILIASPLQQWLYERASLSRQEYIACLLVLGVYVAVNNINVFIVVTEIQQWVPYALLTSHKMFRTSVNRSNCYILFTAPIYPECKLHLLCAVL